MFRIRKARILIRKLTLRKLINFFRVWCSFYFSKWMGKPVWMGNPVKLGIEPTTYCNLRCPECISGLRAFTRPTGMMEVATIQNLLSQTKNDLVYLLMYFQGEPFLNPAFLELATAGEAAGVYVATSTNGHYLDPETAKKTVASGISEVLISVDGVTQESYVSYRVGGDLEKVKNGIRNLVNARKEARSLSPVILLQFLVVNQNEHEIKAIQKLGKDLGVDKVLLKTAQIYEYENGSPFIPQNEKYSRYKKEKDGRYSIKNPLDNQCWKLWMGAEITWDGKVLPCCFDKDGKYVMGELGKSNFSQIWNSDAYKNFRVNLLQSRRSIEICTNCSEGTQVWS